jgi:hypothetical protein
MTTIQEGEYKVEVFRDERGELVIIVSAGVENKVLRVACDPDAEYRAQTIAFRAIPIEET